MQLHAARVDGSDTCRPPARRERQDGAHEGGGGRKFEFTSDTPASSILLYLLIAVLFGTLFMFVGLSIPDAFKGIAFEDNAALANSVFYLSFVTLTSTGYGDIVPHPIARTLCTLESLIGQLYPATFLARIVTLEMRQGSG